MSKLIDLPDGTRGEFPDDMADSEIKDVLRSKFPPEAESLPQAFMRGARDVGTGVATGFGHLGAALWSPADLAYDVYKGQPGGTSNRLRRESISQFGKEHADPESLNYAIAHATPEMIATGGPISRAGVALATRLPKALGRLAPAAADIGVNAAYEGGKALATGEDAGTAALYGGGGAAGGRFLVRALGGIKPMLSGAAQTLIDKGILPTPGKALGGVPGSIEDKLLSLPIVGDIGQLARKRGLEEYGRAEVNDALKPLNAKVNETGSKAIDAAEARIGEAYKTALDGMDMGTRHIDDAISKTRAQMAHISLLDKAQAAKLNKYIESRLAAPNVRLGGISGDIAKTLDAEIGYLARKFSRSPNPSDHSLGEAFYTLQTNWRAQMAQAADDLGMPGKTALLTAANNAYKNLLPIVKASDKAMAQGGTFTPNQLQRSYGPYHQEQSALNEAAQEVLPSRVPDSGTAGRLMLGAITAGGGAAYDVGLTATAAVVAAAVASRPGLKLLYDGVAPSLKPHIRSWLEALPDDKKREFLIRYAKEVPEVAQLAAQIGRQLAVPHYEIRGTSADEQRSPP
jgi:hypothetical protein